MKLSDVIREADELMPNQFSDGQKRRWLRTLEGQLWEEVFLAHRDCPPAPDPDSECLLAKEPYGRDLYVYYLESCVARENGEMQKYNQYAVLFNRALLDFQNAYNRAHLPLHKGAWRF